MSHLYEVTTSTGSNTIINATDSQDAKKKVCKQLGFNPMDPWAGTSSMKAHRINVDYLEVNYRPSDVEEVLQQYKGKDVVIYDDHHGTAIRIKKAAVATLQHYIDDYSSIIVLV